MQRITFQQAADWNQGGYNNGAYLDTQVNVDQYSNPAVSPAQAVNSLTTYSGSNVYQGEIGTVLFLLVDEISSTLSGSSGWTAAGGYAYTTTALGTMSIQTNALLVTIQLAGVLGAGGGAVAGAGFVAGQFRNGAVVNILVDGALVQAVDTWQATPSITLHLDGLAHTIGIQHSGGHNANFSYIGPVQSAGGTTVAATLQPTESYHGTPIAASWRVGATSPTQYTLYQTLPGGSETTVVAGLNTGTTYTAYVPGVNLLVGSNVSLVNGDSATFTTDVVMCALESVTLGTGATAGGAATWQSPTLDLGTLDAQGFVLEWDENVPLSAVTVSSAVDSGVSGLHAGLIPAGGSSAGGLIWSAPVTLTPAHFTLPVSGQGRGIVGLYQQGNAVPPGRYLQFTFHFPPVATVTPYVRNAALYAWVPARDPLIQAKQGLTGRRQAGPVKQAFDGALLCSYMERRQDALDLNAAAAGPLYATNSYLARYAADYGLTWPTGEPQAALRVRLLAILQSRLAPTITNNQVTQPGGMSLPWIAYFINWYISGQPVPPVTTVVSGALAATCGGVVVAKTTGAQFSVSVPAAPYAGLVGLSTPFARTLITNFITQLLTPAGSIITPNNTGSNITFN